jgi:hypothetical protein
VDKLTAFLTFLATLSLATERITEAVKGLPGLSLWLAAERPAGALEEARKASIHLIAIMVGTVLTAMTQQQLQSVLGWSVTGFWPCFLFGAMASGGSGLWNSALDIAREVNRQKQLYTNELKAKAPAKP